MMIKMILNYINTFQNQIFIHLFHYLFQMITDYI